MTKKFYNLICLCLCLQSCSAPKGMFRESILEKVEYISANECFTEFSVRAIFSTIGNESEREQIIKKQIMKCYDISDAHLIIVETAGKTYGQFNYKITKSN